MPDDKTLFMCRTTFQLYFCRKIALFEGFSSYDVVYVTRHDSEKDRFYFNKIKAYAENAFYFNHPKDGGTLTGYAKIARSFPRWLLSTRYSRMYISSFNVWYYRFLLRAHQKYADIYTFDDGSANFYQKAVTIREKANLKDKIYNVPIFGFSIDTVIKRTKGHYTINASLDNIVERQRLTHIPVGNRCSSSEALSETFRMFAGQNFAEYLDAAATQRIKEFVENENLTYFPHPREKINGSEFHQNMQVINSNLIIEDYIDQILESYQKVELYGAFSTALMTTDSLRVEKVYVSVDGNAERKGIMAKFGCAVRDL